ncbi:MAG: hypothetical protein K2J99_04905 [Lachnospiraceae bacterium]|nr:hypothetical protein [Lachnospiraceae bacterium]
MAVIWKWFCGGALLIPVLIILIGNLAGCWYQIRCFKIKKCSDRKCRYRTYCHKYEEVLTQKDKERIQKLIDQL